MDGRINNGGHSTKGYAGRKPKEDENRIRTLSINALKSIYGSEQDAFEHIAKLAEDSFPHLKLLLEYAYGKPRQAIQVKQNSTEEENITVPPFPLEKLSLEALREIQKIYEECEETAFAFRKPS